MVMQHEEMFIVVLILSQFSRIVMIKVLVSWLSDISHKVMIPCTVMASDVSDW